MDQEVISCPVVTRVNHLFMVSYVSKESFSEKLL